MRHSGATAGATGAGREPSRRSLEASERRLRISTLPPHLEHALVLEVDGELRRAHRDHLSPARLRRELVEAVRRFVQRYGLTSVGYRFERSLSSAAQPADALMAIVEAAYAGSVLVYTDGLARHVVEALEARGAL